MLGLFLMPAVHPLLSGITQEAQNSPTMPKKKKKKCIKVGEVKIFE